MHTNAMTETLTLAALVLAAACSAPAAAPAPPAPAAVAPIQDHTRRAPFVVTVNGPTEPTRGEEVELVVVIERTQKGTPLDVTIGLPPGAQLVRGSAHERIEDDADRIERRLLVRVLGELPRADVQVAVASGDASFGAHAVAAYRFGRPAPRLLQPPRMARPLVWNGRHLGHPILLTPP